MHTKFLSIAAGCALLIGCASCSGNASEKSDESSTTVEQTAASDESAEQAPTSGASIEELSSKALTATDFTDEEYTAMVDYMESNLDALAAGDPKVAGNFASFYSAVGAAADHGLLPEALTEKWQTVESGYKALQ